MNKDWMQRAACKDMSFPMFFDNDKGPMPNKIKKLCASCPVNLECLIEAIETDSEGIWAATSAKRRRMMDVKPLYEQLTIRLLEEAKAG
jgi:WhiB family redox-sensing transcriptional regulator